jgi:hypothetical protein
MHPERFELFVADKFDDFLVHTKYLIGWAFRGHSDITWLPMSSMERLAQNYGFSLANLWNRESVILREFQQAAHDYLRSPPAESDRIEWISLLQHYGGPTRLLDFTHSEFVAAFFAMERANGDAAVWGINLTKIEQWIADRLRLGPITNIEEVRRRHLGLAETFVGAVCDEPAVLNVNPNRMHERLLIQQGLFVFPADIRRTFMENLTAMCEIPLETITDNTRIPRQIGTLTADDILEKWLVKIILPRRMHKNAIFRLARMNISASSLFPGLDGFCRSFERHMRVAESGDGIA